MLRTHQQQMVRICQSIAKGAQINKIVALVTCGGGKALLPMIAQAALNYRIAWFVPRSALQNQAEEVFQDPKLRALTGYEGRGIRKSTNDSNPSRDRCGFVTTYQALAKDDGTLEAEFRFTPHILVLDECHLVTMDAVVEKKLKALASLARIILLMTGTAERHDSAEISFLNYKSHDADGARTKWIDLEGRQDTAIIQYNRGDAIRDKAIIPLVSRAFDAKAEWKKDNKTVSVKSIRSLTGSKASRALLTALSTKFALELLNSCISDWLLWRDISNPQAKMLVVAPTQKEARRYAAEMESQGIPCGLAISDNGAACAKIVKQFRKGQWQAVATCGVCYIGLDVPSITHVALLTRIRSKPWLEQAIGRAMRYDPNGGPWERQQAHVFMPDDEKMRAIVAKIEADVMSVIREQLKAGKPRKMPPQTDLFGDIIPLSSSVTKNRSKRHFVAPPATETPKTPSELEGEAREEIETHVRRYAKANRMAAHEVNKRIKAKFGKSRKDMTLIELERVRLFVTERLN